MDNMTQTPLNELLSSCLLHLKRTDWNDALTSLIQAWNFVAANPFAEAVMQIAQFGLQIGHPLKNKTVRERYRIWDQLLASHSVIELSALLDEPLPWKTTITRQRLYQLSKLPPDPRLTTYALQRVLPYLKQHIQLSWSGFDERLAKHAFAFLATHGNASIIEPAEALKKINAKKELTTYLNSFPVRELALRKPISLPDECSELMQMITEEIQCQQSHLAAQMHTGEELLQAIWNEPEADEPRQVYSDWLLERAHPHGELIMLQMLAHERKLIHEERKREQQLIQALRAELIPPPISQQLISASFVVSRGFVSHVTLVKVCEELKRYKTSPFWKLIEHIDIRTKDPSGSIANLLDAENMRALRWLGGLHAGNAIREMYDRGLHCATRVVRMGIPAGESAQTVLLGAVIEKVCPHLDCIEFVAPRLEKEDGTAIGRWLNQTKVKLISPVADILIDPGDQHLVRVTCKELQNLSQISHVLTKKTLSSCKLLLLRAKERESLSYLESVVRSLRSRLPATCVTQVECSEDRRRPEHHSSS